MGERGERNCTICVPRETLGCQSTGSGVKMSEAKSSVTCYLALGELLTKNGDNGMVFTFRSHVSLNKIIHVKHSIQHFAQWLVSVRECWWHLSSAHR